MTAITTVRDIIPITDQVYAVPEGCGPDPCHRPAPHLISRYQPNTGIARARCGITFPVAGLLYHRPVAPCMACHGRGDAVRFVTAGRPPRWAVRVAAEVAEAHGLNLTLLVWRRTAKAHTTGVTYTNRGRVTISAGTHAAEHLPTLLHELAHLITPGEKHGPAFWDALARLAREHGAIKQTAACHSRRFAVAVRRTRGGQR